MCLAWPARWQSCSVWIRTKFDIYGAVVMRRIRAMGIRDKPIAPASPWQNGFAERLIGSIRRECLDHFIGLGEAHLRRVCADLPPSRADWKHQFTPDPWRTSSPICSSLGFRYTQPRLPLQAHWVGSWTAVATAVQRACRSGLAGNLCRDAAHASGVEGALRLKHLNLSERQALLR